MSKRGEFEEIRPDETFLRKLNPNDTKRLRLLCFSEDFPAYFQNGWILKVDQDVVGENRWIRRLLPL